MQDEILEFLKRNSGEKFSIKELQIFLGIEKSIYPNIKKLVKEDCINWEEVIGKDRRHTYSVYWYKEAII